jgi:hypothetical protein
MSASHELHSLEDKATTLTLNNSSSSTAEADQWLRDNGKSSFLLSHVSVFHFNDA